tara:strand:- start:69 stop:458 length:390 start_codon:yes stop_codon:yes gene_type:complete
MFTRGIETYNTVTEDATDDFRMVTTTIKDNFNRTIEVHPVLTPVAEAGEDSTTTFSKGFISGSYTETDDRDGVASNSVINHTSTSGGTDRIFTKTIVVQELEDNSYSKVTKQRLVDGVVTGSTSRYENT